MKGEQIILKLWGEHPFEMHAAADALVKLSMGIHDEPLLDVSWSDPYHPFLYDEWLQI